MLRAKPLSYAQRLSCFAEQAARDTALRPVPYKKQPDVVFLTPFRLFVLGLFFVAACVGGAFFYTTLPATEVSLKTLEGMTKSEARQRLGQPAFSRVEEPAEIWQFKTAQCIIELYFYNDSNKIYYAEARPRDRTLPHWNERDCGLDSF